MNHAGPAVCFMLHSEHQDIKVKTVCFRLDFTEG